MKKKRRKNKTIKYRRNEQNTQSTIDIPNFDSKFAPINDSIDPSTSKKSKGKLALKIILIILTCFILFTIIVGLTFYFFMENKLNKINYVGLTSDQIEINNGVSNNLSSYRNIALLGLDTREDSYTGCRSDGIMIISINEKTHDVKITSVYRDTYLDLRKNNTDNIYLDKITHAYAFGNAQQTLSSLNRNLDLNITEFVAVNFSAVVEIVDSVGGIDMNITADEVKYINGYIDGIQKNTGKSSSHITTPGIHHLDGVQALAYCRIRYTDGGDFKRTERMRDVLVATFEKAKNMNPVQINKLADTVLPHISTNIQKNKIYDAISQMFSYHVNESAGWPYNVKGSTMNGVWYGVPTNLEQDVSQLYYNLFGIENYEPSQTVKDISNEIVNKTN